MPPRRYPPSLLESLAAMAENLSKLVTTITINNEKLAASQSKLNVAIKNLATHNERILALISNKCFPESTSYTMKPKIISKDVVTQNTTTINISTMIIKTNIEVATYTPPPLPPRVQHDTATLHQTCDFSTLIQDKLVTASTSSMTKIQNEVALQTRVSLSLLIEDMLAIFRCVKTYHPGHQCHPPKFVFIQIVPEPPLKPHDTRDRAMSLEDKARFKARSIDTCMKTASNHDLYIFHVIQLN